MVSVATAIILAGCASQTATPPPTSPTPVTTLHASPVIAVIGDFGSGDDDERAVADLVSSRHPDAIVTTGDNVYGSGGYDALVGAYYGDAVARKILYPVPGNHDHEEGIENYDAYFSYLDGQRDYTVTLGNVSFFMLDGEESLASLDSAHNQAAWLADAVAASDSTYRVVVVHYPPFSSSQHGSTPGLQWDYQGMGIDLVLSGHDHVYERIDSGGVTYIVDGTGGKQRYDCGDPVPGSLVCIDSTFGAVFLAPGGDVLHGEFVGVDGTILDEFDAPATR